MFNLDQSEIFNLKSTIAKAPTLQQLKLPAAPKAGFPLRSNKLPGMRSLVQCNSLSPLETPSTEDRRPPISSWDLALHSLIEPPTKQHRFPAKS